MIAIATKIPIGLKKSAFIQSPFKNNSTDRVVPHEAHGIPVIFFKLQIDSE